jgi:hypothetical protein
MRTTRAEGARVPVIGRASRHGISVEPIVRPSRVLIALAAAARRAMLLMVAVSLAVGLAVAVPSRVSAGSSGCGVVWNCVTVTFNAFGNGRGDMVAMSQGNGINCHYANGVLTGTCSYEYKWTIGPGWLQLDVAYTPDAHSQLCFQIGVTTCSGAGVRQTYTLGLSPTAPPDTEQRFEFQLVPQTVTVTKTGVASGTVVSVQPGISCGATCVAQFEYGTAVRLTAKPDAGAVFTAWTGACAGQGKTCTLKLTKDLATNAVFSLPTAPPTPTSRPIASAKATATAAPTASAASLASGAPAASPSPSDGGLTAVAVPTPAGSASAAPAQAPLPVSGDAGVPVAIVVVLMVMALLIGGLAVALALVLRRGKAS